MSDREVVAISCHIDKSIYEVLRRVAYETRLPQREIIEKALLAYFEKPDERE